MADHPEVSWADREDDGFFDYDNVAPDVAGQELVSFLVELKLQNTLSAKQCCTLAFWASRAGASGDVGDLALRPDAQSGKFSRKFDEFAGKDSKGDGMYQVGIAKRVRHEAARVWQTVPMVLPHEAFSIELAEWPEPVAELDRALAAKELPPIYFDHPAVRSAPDGVRVLPVSIYVDGVAYQRLDSCLGLWAYFSLSGRRHLLCVLRKSEACTCGCRAWCSLHPIWQVIAWSLEHLAKGVHPSARHDGQPFGCGDEGRAALAGTPLGFRGACLFIKCDLAEHAHSMGLPATNDAISPCPFCFSVPADFFKLVGLSPLGPPMPSKTLAHYTAACDSCEIGVTLNTPEERSQLRSALFFDKRADGSHGRAVQAHLPAIGLLKGDRLEPSPLMSDVALVDEAPLPCSMVFWRVRAETQTRHRIPIFSEVAGVGPQTIGIDWLHTLSLGVMQTVLSNLVWALLNANIYRVVGPVSSVVELGVARMRQELFDFYVAEQAQGRVHCRVQQFLPSMIGSNAERKLALHAAETNGFLHFGAFLLDRHGSALGTSLQPYNNAIRSLLKILGLIREHPRVFPLEDAQSFVDAVITHMRALDTLNIAKKPKHHFLIEMAGRSLV